MSTRSTQVLREGSTQTTRYDLYMDGKRDVEVAAGPYRSADAVMHERDASALQIQCAWRVRLAHLTARRMRELVADAHARAQEAALQEQKLADARLQKEVNRRLHPRSADDFARLYDEVEAWRVAEMRQLSADLDAADATEDERRHATAHLLTKEVSLIATIDRLRITAGKENQAARVEAFMKEISTTKKWQLGDGQVATVETPATARAKELKALFDALTYTGAEGNASAEDRIAVLDHLRSVVSAHPCPLSKEIVELSAREQDMLVRRRPVATVLGLRQRLRNLFISFCETPAFNPEAARFSRLPADLMSTVLAQRIAAPNALSATRRA
jgi:hypothetical protein